MATLPNRSIGLFCRKFNSVDCYKAILSGKAFSRHISVSQQIWDVEDKETHTGQVCLTF